MTRRLMMILPLLLLASPATADPLVSVAASGQGSCSAKQVTTAAALQVTATAGNISRKNVTIQNLGPNAIWCNFVSTASNTNGLRVDPNGGFLSLDVGAALTLWCRADTADQVSPADTRVCELR